MHKWESTEKLLPLWESVPINTIPFVYNDLEYTKSEFDNVPPVVPKFLFFLQNNLKPIAAYCKELKDSQSVADLRSEVQGWVSEAKQDVKDSEARLNTQISTLKTTCADLQKQLD